MKRFALFVDFPDKFSDEEVLFDIVNHLPMNSYAEVGVQIKTDNLLAAKFDSYVKKISMASLTKPSEIKS